MIDTNTSSSIFVNDFSEFYESFYELNYSNSDNGTYVPNPNTLACNSSPISFLVSVLISVFYLLIFLLAIPGNLLVCLVIGFSQQALTPSNLYLLHLAVADILLALTLPFWATDVVLGWLFGDAMCKIVSLLQEVSFYASILFLACISVDRYLVIVRNMGDRKANLRLKSWVACGAIWLIGGVLSLPGLYNQAYTKKPGLLLCDEIYDPKTANGWRLLTSGLRHTLGFLVPLAVMLVCYGVTVARLQRTRGGFQRKRAMRVIVAVVVAFLLCWTPYHLAVVVDTLLRAKAVVEESCGMRRIVDKVLFATLSLGLLHSCVNPVLYAFVGEKFRQRLLQLLRKSGMMRKASVSMASRSSQSTVSTLM